MVLALGLGNAGFAEIQWHETNREVQGKSLNDPNASDGIKIYGRQVAENIDDFKPDVLVKTAAILPENRHLSGQDRQPDAEGRDIGPMGVSSARRQ